MAEFEPKSVQYRRVKLEELIWQGGTFLRDRRLDGKATKLFLNKRREVKQSVLTSICYMLVQYRVIYSHGILGQVGY